MIIALLAAAAAQGQPQTLELPATLPIYCLDSKEEPQRVRGTTLGSLRGAFQRQFSFSAKLTKTGPRIGKLQFRGGDGNADTITYDVATHADGIALLIMRVRLIGVNETLICDDMCWKTLSFVTAD
jgi:hypothetical protein